MKKRSRAKTNAYSMLRVAGEGAGVFVDSALSSMFDQFSTRTEHFMDTMEDRFMEFRKHVVQRMFASILIGVGAMFLFVSLLMYLVTLFNLRWATAFLIVGVIILAIAFIIQARHRR